MKGFFKSFKYAGSGVIKAIKSERNMRIHICMAFYVIIAAIIARLGAAQWLAVLICCALVIGAEAINTAIERLCDAVYPERDKRIGAVKDIAAGGVLVCAVFSAAVGCIVFFSGESLANIAEFVKARAVLTAAIACTTVPAIIFICGRKRDGK